jgi:hypothetical protein
MARQPVTGAFARICAIARARAVHPRLQLIAQTATPKPLRGRQAPDGHGVRHASQQLKDRSLP